MVDREAEGIPTFAYSDSLRDADQYNLSDGLAQNMRQTTRILCPWAEGCRYFTRAEPVLFQKTSRREEPRHAMMNDSVQGKDGSANTACGVCLDVFVALRGAVAHRNH